jgi:hypothetical protein
MARRKHGKAGRLRLEGEALPFMADLNRMLPELGQRLRLIVA